LPEDGGGTGYLDNLLAPGPTWRTLNSGLRYRCQSAHNAAVRGGSPRS
jgi:hypothetical protein